MVKRRCLALCTSMAAAQAPRPGATAQPLPHSNPAGPRPAAQDSEHLQGQQGAPAAAASAPPPGLSEPGNRHQQPAEPQQATEPGAEYGGPSWAAVHSLMTSSSHMAVRSEALLLLGHAARQAVARDCSAPAHAPAHAPASGPSCATSAPAQAERSQPSSPALQPGQQGDSSCSALPDRQGAAGPESASAVLVQHLQLCSQPEELEDMRLVSAEALAASGQQGCTARNGVSKVNAAAFLLCICSSVGTARPRINGYHWTSLSPD